MEDHCDGAEDLEHEKITEWSSNGDGFSSSLTVIYNELTNLLCEVSYLLDPLIPLSPEEAQASLIVDDLVSKALVIKQNRIYLLGILATSG